MLWRPLALVGLAFLLGGCTANRLRHHTIKQGNTLVDLQYQQVLDNLALFSSNPAAIPWHMNLKEGTTQITDSASGGAAVDIGPPSDTLPQLFGSRTIVGQWGMSPVVDPLELKLLRYAYRRACGIEEKPAPEFYRELSHELKKQVALHSDLRAETDVFYEYLTKANPTYNAFESQVVTANQEDFALIPPEKELSPLAREVRRQVDEIDQDLKRIGSGWFHVGRKHQVPRRARHLGQYRDCHVWVEPEGEEQLAEFTLIVLKFSSLIKETATLVNPGSVKFSPGDRN